MDPAKIFPMVVGLLAGVCSYPAARMQPSTSLRDDLGIGSLELLELVMALEHELGIVVQDGDFSEARTIGDVVETARLLVAAPRTP